MKIPTIAAGFLLALCSSTAAAGNWAVQPDASSLRFAGVTQGENFEGAFGKFEATIAFDPKALAGSKFDVTITLASADTKNEERDDTLRGSDFFAVDEHPSAHFTATEFVAVGNRFEARGTLELRGASKPVTLTFDWTPNAGGARLEGEATLDRTAFGVGGGDWADAEMIAHEVKVATTLILTPAD
jgi:polyisoprenoid-binding protein YceI